MNPKDFSWSADQQVTVTNPTDETFKFKVHSKDYELGAGKTAKMPGYIAWVFVNGLASKIAQDAGEYSRWNEEGFKQTYFEKVVVKVDDLVQGVEVEEDSPVEEVNTGQDAPKEPEAPAAGTGGNYTPKAKAAAKAK